MPINRLSRTDQIGGLKLHWSSEARCLRRNDLINTLYNALPPDVVKFGHQIVSVKLDPQTNYPVLQLQNGNSITAKVLVGCDGAKSVVADFLQLKPTKLAALCSARGVTNYPNGHPFPHEFVRMRRNNTAVGRIPIDSNLVYWFVAHPWVPTDTNISQDRELIRQNTLQVVKSFPKETVEMIKNTDSDSLSFTRIRYRRPWDLLLGSFRQGTVTVAGDAMHVMGPFIAQGGSAGLEDAVVLVRNLAKKMSIIPTDPRSIGEALDEYVKERRMRVVRMSTQSYLTAVNPRQPAHRLRSPTLPAFSRLNISGNGILAGRTNRALSDPYLITPHMEETSWKVERNSE
nr:PREDICTED: putative oxidoreductase YetM isoform X2 [Daucus carota subsp. sativus]XP_017237146.1 PREDICTED: putative oxidoreductase YetM isoform X2 [Daucus carota subsp. sativus]